MPHGRNRDLEDFLQKVLDAGELEDPAAGITR